MARLVLFLIFIVLGSFARADSSAEATWKECQSVDDNLRLAACTKVIAAQGFGNKKRLADAYDGRCWALHAMGRYQEAVSDCEISVSIISRSAYVFHNLGVSYFGLKNFGKAIQAFSQALALNPKQVRSFVKRGHAYASIGKLNEASSDYRSALQLSPNNTEALASIAALTSNPRMGSSAVLQTEMPNVTPSNAQRWDYVSVTSRQKSGGVRRALLIANDDYRFIGKLDGPLNDVRQTSALLKQLGFDTVILNNPGRSEILQAIRSSNGPSSGGLFLLYYSGHAAAINGENTVLLTRFDPNNGLDRENSFLLADLLKELAATDFEKVLVAFDACRNAVKIAADQVAPSSKHSREVKAVRGLQLSSDEAQTLRRKEYSILFSTSAGEFALDVGNDGLSPFTKAFNSAVKTESSFIPAMVLAKKLTEEATRSAQSPTIEIKWNSDLTYQQIENYPSSARYGFDLTLPPSDDQRRSKLSALTQSLDERWRIAKMLSIREDAEPGCSKPTSFFWRSSFFNLTGCYLKRLGFDEAALKSSGGEGYEWSMYDNAEWKTDLDYDGRPETFIASMSRYGQSLTIKSQAREVEFTGLVGANIETIGTFDFNGDGVLDVLLTLRLGDDYLDSGEQIIILDGRRIISNLQDVHNCADRSASKTDCDAQRSLSSALKGSVAGADRNTEPGNADILQITMFLDWRVKYWSLKRDGTLEYTTYGPSWQFDRNKDNEDFGEKKRVAYQRKFSKFSVEYDVRAAKMIAPLYEYLKTSHPAEQLAH